MARREQGEEGDRSHDEAVRTHRRLRDEELSAVGVDGAPGT